MPGIETQLTFAPVSTGEIDKVLAMIAAYYLEDGDKTMDEPFSRVAVEAIISEPRNGGLWFICVDDRPVGYLCVTLGFSLEYGGRDAILDEIYIEPAYRNQGIGQIAIQFSEDYCRQHGIKAIHLEVYDGNPAIELYRRAGYEQHSSEFFTKWLGERPTHSL